MHQSSSSKIVASTSRLEDGDELSTQMPKTSHELAVGSAALRIEAHTTFEAARAEWARFQAVAHGYPFQHHDWLEVWYETIGRAKGIEPFIVVVKDGIGVVRAVYPLGIRKRRWTRLLVPLGEGVCDYHAPLMDTAFFARLPATSRAEIWKAIKSMAPADTALLERLMLDEHGNAYGTKTLYPHRSSTHVLRLGDDWEEFYLQRRGPKTRRTLREKYNRLAKRGPVRFALAETVADRERLLSLAVDLKEKQLRYTGYRNPYRHEQVRAFYRGLAALSPTDSAVRVFALEAGDETAAVAVCMVHGERLYYLVPAYDRDGFGKCSPGLLLLCEMMRWSIEHGLKFFDFTIGDETYKDDWCDVTIPLAYSVDALTVRGRVAAAAMVGSLAVKRLIAGHPALRPIALVALDRLWSVRQRLGGRDTSPQRPPETSE
jgi:CelD/BcsL family acetyltransferase involved in cellulose biosynthesis